MCRSLPIVASLLLVACVGDTVAPGRTSVPDNPVPLARVQGDAHASKRGGRLVVWGDNSAQQLSAAPVRDDIRAIAVGGPKQGLAIRGDGSLVLWGGAANAPPIPDSVANRRYDDASLSLTFLLAIRNDHSVVAWGRFFSPDGNGPSAAPPSRLKARGVAGGSAHAVAIQLDHTLRTWGSGLAASAPPEGKFSQVGARTSYSIALRRDGTLFGWGAVPSAPTIFGEGNGWASDEEGHFFVPNDRFVAIAAGNSHILALRADGTVAGWGRNLPGAECCATQAPAGIRFTAIAAGLDYSIGLDRDGAIHLWGDAREGRSAVPTGRFVSIGAGARHAAALRFDGTSK
jgi:alpha-tubulin suppressor-like RCC1 family protein